MAVPAIAEPFEDATKAYDRGDYKTAYRLFKPLAEQGNAYAPDNLGVMYEYGQGVPQDFTEAVAPAGSLAGLLQGEASYRLQLWHDPD